MKNHKRAAKSPTKDLITEAFMKAPFPMIISKAEDGTYVEANEAAMKYLGLEREKILGRKAPEIGLLLVDPRQSFISQIREKGFAVNVPIDLDMGKKGILKMFFGAYPLKRGDEEFFCCFAHGISNHQSNSKVFKDDKFRKITFLDYQLVKSMLAQYPLTARQQEITLLSALGNSNIEIAKKLCISEYTVKDHLKEIFSIIGIRNRGELFPKMLNLR